MKKRMLALLLLLPALACAAKPDSTEYSVHVQSASLYSDCGGSSSLVHCAVRLRLNVVIDGKKFELAGDTDSNVLKTGDYKARLVKDEHPTPYEYEQTYEFLFPDGQKQKFRVVGESE